MTDSRLITAFTWNDFSVRRYSPIEFRARVASGAIVAAAGAPGATQLTSTFGVEGAGRVSTVPTPISATVTPNAASPYTILVIVSPPLRMCPASTVNLGAEEGRC